MNKVNQANMYGMSIFSLAKIDAPTDEITPDLFDNIFTPDYWNDDWHKCFAVYVRPRLYELMGWTEPSKTFDTTLTLHIDEVRESLHSLQRHQVVFRSYVVMEDGAVLLISADYTTQSRDMTDLVNQARYEQICNIMRGVQ